MIFQVVQFFNACYLNLGIGNRQRIYRFMLPNNKTQNFSVIIRASSSAAPNYQNMLSGHH